MIPGKRYTPQDILHIALRRKWLIVAPLVIATIVVAGVLYRMPNMYWSETLILVVPQRVPESYVRSTVTARIEDRLQSIRQQILSRTRLERIITDLNLYPETQVTTPMEDIVAYMRTQVQVELVRGDAFKVGYSSEDPVVAMRVVERLATLVIEENLRDRSIMAEGTNQFLETQLQESRARLLEHEKKLEAYRRAHIGELPTQAQSNIQAVQTLQAQMQGLTDSISRDRDRLFIVERELSDMPARIEAGAIPPMNTPPTPVDADGLPVGSAAERLEAARIQLRNLELRLKPEHPDIIRAKRIVGELEIKAAEERKAAKPGQPPPVAAPSQTAIREAVLQDERAMLSRQITAKEEQIEKVRSQIGGYQSRLDAIPTRESEMTEMMRDYETLKNIYTELLAKREDSKVAANLEARQVGEQFKIVDPPSLAERPFSPNRPFVAAAGVGIGLAVGLGLVLLLEVRDRTFRSDLDIQQALGLPVLAMIPRMSSAAERQRRRRIMLWSTSAAVVTLAVAAVLALQWIR
jgi:polysaccharide chain length determinant protein (PEP-CTERM system associated)